MCAFHFEGERDGSHLEDNKASPNYLDDLFNIIDQSRGLMCFENTSRNELYIWNVTQEKLEQMIENSSLLQGFGSYVFGHSKDGNQLRILKLIPPLIVVRVEGKGIEEQQNIEVVSYEGGS